jgi:KUP system potassium uptake protein
MQKAVGKLSAGLLVGALGVVFGDIGTSPLYVMRVVFGGGAHQLPVQTTTVFGLISLVIWTITLVVSVEYIGCIMHADNKGEGGIMALVARLKASRLSKRTKTLLILAGLVGVALFYGDSAITPAISVLSAVEGMQVAHPHLSGLVVPITIMILVWLFWVQKYGTGLIGRLFGPVMLVWFTAIGLAGLGQILQYPAVWVAILPSSAVQFVAAMPGAAFLAMGAVVLAVTGAEALFADMGHFGRPPIARTWFLIVFPALTLCYMGQGAALLRVPASTANPFFFLFPQSLHFAVVALAAVATLIASQAVISGAFSLTRQAVQLGFLPHLTIRHTSDNQTGQIYVPLINFLLFAAVMLFVLLFGSSVKLAGAYGIAVSGAITVDTLLFFAVVSAMLRRFSWALALPAAIFLAVDGVLVLANIPKIVHGGWAPLLVATAVFVLIDTWRRGEEIVKRERRSMEGPLDKYIEKLHSHEPRHLVRVPGQAVYIGHHPGMAPLALHAAIENMHELQEKVVIVYVTMTEAAHVPEHERAIVDTLKYADGISQVTLRYGFHDSPNIPRALEAIRHMSPELNFNPHKASYFISLTTIVTTNRRTMARWRKSLYALMARNSLSTSDYYKLPLANTEEVHSIVQL